MAATPRCCGGGGYIADVLNQPERSHSGAVAVAAAVLVELKRKQRTLADVQTGDAESTFQLLSCRVRAPQNVRRYRSCFLGKQTGGGRRGRDDVKTYVFFAVFFFHVLLLLFRIITETPIHLTRSHGFFFCIFLFFQRAPPPPGTHAGTHEFTFYTKLNVYITMHATLRKLILICIYTCIYT